MKNLSISRCKTLTIISLLLLSAFNQTFASRQPKRTCLVLTQQGSVESRILSKGSTLNHNDNSDPNTTYKNFTLTYDQDGKIFAASCSRQITGRTTITSEKLLVGQAIIAYRQSECGRNYNDTQPATILDTVIPYGNNQSYTIPAKDIFWKIRMMNKKHIHKKLDAINQQRRELAEQQKQQSWCTIN